MNTYWRIKPVMNFQSSLGILRGMLRILVFIFCVFAFCEYIIYYVVLVQCTWPQLDNGHQSYSQKPLKIALISDTHLLGTRRGHWFDKLRREWQMYRSFQTMMTIHNPSVIFFLGDLFDEGLWSDDAQFDLYVQRFHSLFKTTDDVQTYVVVGNHDIGFHYSITPSIHQRFVRAFNVTPITVTVIRGNIFVLINSMAMERDGCFLCEEAKMQLEKLFLALNCTEGNKSAHCEDVPFTLPRNTKPILLQHFPMYRKSDALCEGPDVAPPNEKKIIFRETWECLSKESSNLLLHQLKPRLIFGGHTHNGCFLIHKGDIPEWSVPSFSWRNRNNPSYLLVTLTPESYAVAKCFLPQESTVVNMYITSAILLFLWLMFFKCCMFYRGSHVKHR